jgi:hypothetical protein
MPFGLAIKAGEEVSKTFSIPQPAHLQRSTLNQSRRDPAAKDTIGLHPPPQSADESVSEFCLPRLRLDRKERLATPLLPLAGRRAI